MGCDGTKASLSTPQYPTTYCPRLFFALRRYVKGAEYMNVNSQTQIRQLLFPGQCPEPTKTFRAANPAYDPALGRTGGQRRWVDFELHGLWGQGQPGRLQPDVTTKKGSAAVSTAVLWSLVGKPGAAAKALAELDAAEAAEAAEAVARSDGSSSSSNASDATAQSAAAAAAASGVSSMVEDDISPHEAQDDDDNDATAAAAGAEDADSTIRIVPGADLTDAELALLQAEAASMKLGKMYAAMGGGREGLEACMALEKLIEVSLEVM